MTSSPEAGAVESRARSLFDSQRREHSARTDRLMRWVVAIQTPVVLVSAAWLAPRLAAGHPSLVGPIGATAAVALVAVTLASLLPGALLTRHVIACAQMALSAILLDASDGHANLHLHAVGSFALISLYRDWTIIGTASAVVLAAHVAVLAHHGDGGPLGSLVLTHTLWLALVDVFLVFVCVRGAHEMRESAHHRAVSEEAERARAAQVSQLAEAEQQSAAMLRGALDAIVSMDERGAIVAFNPAAERLFGYRREEALGRQVSDLLVPPSFRDAHRAGAERYFRTGEKRVMDRRIDVRGWRADGTEVPIELALTDVRVPGRPPLTTAFIRDITDRLDADTVLRSARDAAEGMSRAKSEFVANIGHEMRTPINALLGLIAVMREGDQAGEHRDTLRMMDGSARRLLHVVNDLLDFSHLEAGRITLEPGNVSLRALADQIRDTFGPRAAEKGLAFSVVMAPDLPRVVSGDAARIQQVLRHLLDNALKFTAHGRVSVAIGIEDLEGAPAIRFTVADTGTGIPADRQASIFEAFTQGDSSATRRFGGTGLGLTLAAQLAGLMRGRLTFTSLAGEGSTFRFVVPFAEGRGGSRAALERLGGDDALLGQLVTVFLSSYPGQLAGLRRAVQAGEPEAIRRRAQAIRGAVAFLAEEDAVEAAARVEAAAGQPGHALGQAVDALATTLADLEARLTHLGENTGA